MDYINRGGANDEILSEDVDNIISNKPKFIVRKGNLVLLIVIGFVLLCCWYIQYPDKVEGSARIMAFNSPQIYTARSSGSIGQVYIRNEDTVKLGQIIAIFKNSADHNEVFQLQRWVDSAILLIDKDFVSFYTMPTPIFNSLGEIQNAYGEFLLNKREFDQIYGGKYFDNKRDILITELNNLLKIEQNNLLESEIVKEERNLQSKEVQAYEKLANEKVIAPLELNQYKSKLLAKEQLIYHVNDNLLNIRNSLSSKRKELLDHLKSQIDQKGKLFTSLLDLKSNIDSWFEKNAITASVGGIIYIYNSLYDHQQINPGQDLFYIQGYNSEFYAEVLVSQKGVGKVLVGQDVQLIPESIASEYGGYLPGVISNIANIPNRGDSFLIRTKLKNDLMCNNGKKISFKNHMLAKAFIITSKKRLIQKLFADQLWPQTK